MADRRLVSIILALGAVALIAAGAPSSVANPSSSGKISRAKCLRDAMDYYRDIPIDDTIISLLREARLYYQKDVEPTYKVPKVSEACKEFLVKMRSISSEVPCYFDEEVMVKSKLLNWIDLVRVDNMVKLRFEAEYACVAGRRAGELMRNHHGVYNMIVAYRAGDLFHRKGNSTGVKLTD